MLLFRYPPVVVPDPVVVVVVVGVVDVVVDVVVLEGAVDPEGALVVIVELVGDVVSALPPTILSPKSSSCDWGCSLIHDRTSVWFS